MRSAATPCRSSRSPARAASPFAKIHSRSTGRACSKIIGRPIKYEEAGVSPKRGVAPLRRAEIVRATIRCLARDGYSGLTLKKVARETGLSQGILHYYFADKR